MRDYTAGKPWMVAKQRMILKTAYQLFSEKGIMPVSMQDVAAASGVGRATVFRYFSSKLDLVVAIGAWKWEEYIAAYGASISKDALSGMTAAQYLEFYLDSFLDLYRNHPDILRFNYNFNSYLHYEEIDEERKRPYTQIVDELKEKFHGLYARGQRDGTLDTRILEAVMFSSTFHIMLAAVTRYAVGLVYLLEKSGDPEGELVLLKDMLLKQFTKQE